MKLRDLIENSLSYWSDWGIWAELIDGEFNLNSECRIGEFCFDNGGLADDWKPFASNEEIENFIYSWCDFDPNVIQSENPEYPSLRSEAISQLIFEKNQGLA